MKQISFQIFAIVAATILFTGCETTGDPREGGIFWSETKARERQETLAQESHSSWEKAHREQAITGQLQGQRASLRKRLGMMQNELSALRQSAANAEVASEAAQLERKRTDLQNSPSESTEQLEAQTHDLQTDIDRLKERNNLLLQTQ
jgi:hypothetical protein